MDSSHRQSGFTLTELLVTMAIAAITLTIGVPSFTQTIRDNRMAAYSNALVGALNLARSEASKRGMQVVLCKRNAAGTACNNAGRWEDGWILFADLNGDGVFTDDGNANRCEAAEDCVVQVFEPLAANMTLRTGNNFNCWVAYLPTGVTRGSGLACGGGLSTDTFRLCPDNNVDNARFIVVNNVGRARVRKKDNGDACP